MTNSPLKVAVCGGGIGGLFAAKALIACGLHVDIYEQAPALGEVGAGVFITPNSVRHLYRLGLGPAVEQWGARVGRNSQYFRDDGTPIAPVQVTDSSGWNATFGMHRADLVEFLAKALPAGIVHTGHRCIGYEERGDTARVTICQRCDGGGRCRCWRRWHPLGVTALCVPALASGVSRDYLVSRRGAA